MFYPLAALAGAVIVYLWVSSYSDETLRRLQAKIEQLEREAETLIEQLEDAETERLNALAHHGDVRETERKERERLLLEQIQLKRRIQSLQAQRAEMIQSHDREVAAMRRLRNDQLSDRCQLLLTNLYQTEVSARVHLDGYRVDRPFMESATEAAMEVSTLRIDRSALEEALTASAAIIQSKELEVDSLGREQFALTERCETCERALGARDALMENQTERLEAQAEEVRQWERKMKKERLKRIGWSLGSVGIGFGIGRLTQ